MAIYSKTSIKSDSHNPTQFLAAKIESFAVGYDTDVICEALQIVRKAVTGSVVPSEPSTQPPEPPPTPYDWTKAVLDKPRLK
jgi:hypothetical protein